MSEKAVSGGNRRIPANLGNGGRAVYRKSKL
jgi:hypothetical protein